MDAFEQWLDLLWQKNLKERKRFSDEKRAACACPSCHTYNRCAHDISELLYCISGKSMLCISEYHGCTCKNCPVMREMELKYHDFCMNGGEAAQRYEHEVH